ncbi:hypothetical protein U14_03352 [Candidatus Moduliflexus flocculans]|uniref:Uncharacterized protein n=1 Tax=Candidatus Moduliflexus flocculans TaxID=1499966 RepID=A0A081BNY7_9BACT|nr:hypothetical protein U14_03352 [Candidatus Moduliflexus flocculans]
MSRQCLDYETVYPDVVMGFAELREEDQGCLKNGHRFYFWNTCEYKESLTNQDLRKNDELPDLLGWSWFDFAHHDLPDRLSS